ncbi:MAG: DUF4249 family protein [Chitinophagales bacterium]|nr:DUF4249 family protein [Chitinophagales bacterium]
MILFYTNCEKEIDINLPAPENAVVVEGHIENDMPPYVLLTKNSAFFGGINLNDLAAYFISGASVKVIHQQDTITLKEYNYTNIDEMSDSLREKIIFLMGLSVVDTSSSNILDGFALATIYTIDESVNPNFVGALGGTYQLLIEVDGETITSTTTIPAYTVGFDSLWIESHPNADYADEYFQLYGFLNDPNTTEFYRYFTFSQKTSLLISDNSVFDDAFFNGQRFEIFIPKGRRIGNNSNDETGFDETNGYWNNNDSILNVKLCIIDKPHYDFWRTLESSRNSQGNPFGSFVYVKSNIIGGLGIWGGYATRTQSYYRY